MCEGVVKRVERSNGNQSHQLPSSMPLKQTASMMQHSLRNDVWPPPTATTIAPETRMDDKMCLRADMPTCVLNCIDNQMEEEADEEATKRIDDSLLERTETMDLEELIQEDYMMEMEAMAPSSIVVDYDEDSADSPLRQRSPSITSVTSMSASADCMPAACKPLERELTVKTRRRSRSSSILRGKSSVPKDDLSHEPVELDANYTPEAPERCSSVRKLCLCEVSLHKSVETCWLVANKNVYDVTGLLQSHPAGPKSILRKAGGADCTQDMKFHSKNARKLLEKCFIGKLQPCGDEAGSDDCRLMNATCTIM